MNKELREDIKYHLQQRDCVKEKRRLADQERDLIHKEFLDSIRNNIRKQDILKGSIFEINEENLISGGSFNLKLHQADEYEEDEDDPDYALARNPRNRGPRMLMKICDKMGSFQLKMDGGWIEIDRHSINMSFTNINDCTTFLDKYSISIKTDIVKTIKKLNSQVKKLTVLNEKLNKHIQDK